jgi:hypothetical protein
MPHRPPNVVRLAPIHYMGRMFRVFAYGLLSREEEFAIVRRYCAHRDLRKIDARVPVNIVSCEDALSSPVAANA